VEQAAARVELVHLPSSSAANTRSFADKAETWSALARFVQP
jgi:G:T/U-mismatch repair DNA glycosylase